MRKFAGGRRLTGCGREIGRSYRPRGGNRNPIYIPGGPRIQKIIPERRGLEREVRPGFFSSFQGALGTGVALTFAALSLLPMNCLTACSSGGSGGGNNGGNHQPADDDNDTGGDDTSPGADDDNDDNDNNDSSPDDDDNDDNDSSPQVYDFDGEIDDIFSGNPVSGAKVNLGSYSYTTSADGAFHFKNIPKGKYDTSVDATGYWPCYSGYSMIDDNHTLEGIVLKPAPTTFDQTVLNACCRPTSRIPDDQLETWGAYINLNDENTNGHPITQQMIDWATSIMQDEWPELTNGKLNVVPTQVNEDISYSPVSSSVLAWANNYMGINGGTWDGFDILSSWARVSTLASEGTYRHELTETVTHGKDTNIAQSIFNSTLGQEYYTPNDIQLIQYIYERPSGTTSPDNAPTDYCINCEL